MTSYHTLKTNDFCELKEITDIVKNEVSLSKVTDGICVVYCPHTTAGITINENADPDVFTDIIMKTKKMIERHDKDFRHMEGNSDSHIKSSLFGASETIIIEKGDLLLGTWQGIYFAEFDGPRSRKFMIKIIEG